MTRAAKRADDAPRQAVRDRIAALGTTMKAVSTAMGRNPTYVQQYLDRWIPRELPEKARAQLAGALGIDETELRPALSPQSTGRVNDSSTIVAGSSTPDDATGEQETMLNEDAVTAFEILRELPPDQYQATLAAARRARGKGTARPHRRA